MWRIWNWLFDWDYVYFSYMSFNRITRVLTDKMDRHYVDVSGNRFYVPIKELYFILWLTCPKEKYLGHTPVTPLKGNEKEAKNPIYEQYKQNCKTLGVWK